MISGIAFGNYGHAAHVDALYRAWRTQEQHAQMARYRHSQGNAAVTADVVAVTEAQRANAEARYNKAILEG